MLNCVQSMEDDDAEKAEPLLKETLGVEGKLGDRRSAGQEIIPSIDVKNSSTSSINSK